MSPSAETRLAGRPRSRLVKLYRRRGREVLGSGYIHYDLTITPYRSVYECVLRLEPHLTPNAPFWTDPSGSRLLHHNLDALLEQTSEAIKQAATASYLSPPPSWRAAHERLQRETRSCGFPRHLFEYRTNIFLKVMRTRLPLVTDYLEQVELSRQPFAPPYYPAQ